MPTFPTFNMHQSKRNTIRCRLCHSQEPPLILILRGHRPRGFGLQRARHILQSALTSSEIAASPHIHEKKGQIEATRVFHFLGEPLSDEPQIPSHLGQPPITGISESSLRTHLWLPYLGWEVDSGKRGGICPPSCGDGCKNEDGVPLGMLQARSNARGSSPHWVRQHQPRWQCV